MEATAWRLDQKSCGGGVEVVGFRREGRIWVAIGWRLGGVWRLAFGSKMMTMMTGDGLNPDGDGRRATGDPLSLAIAAGENRWVWVWVLREQWV